MRPIGGGYRNGGLLQPKHGQGYGALPDGTQIHTDRMSAIRSKQL